MGKHHEDTSEAAKALLERKLTELDKTYHLVFIERADRLSDEQVQALLEGKSLYEDPHFDEWYNDARWSGWESVRDELLEPEERDLLDEHPELMDELRFAVEERDQSDPAADLLRETPYMLFRFDMGLDVAPSEFAHNDDAEAAAVAMAEALGVDLDANRDSLRSAFWHASYGGRLFVIAYLDPQDVVGATRATFTNPHVVVLDRLNGSGMDCQVLGEVSVDITTENTVLDSSDRYGWDEIAGVHGPAYAPDETLFEHA